MSDLLEGDISFLPLPDLLQWIDLKGKTCEVNILSGDTGTTLYLEKGELIFASSDKKGLQLGEFLVCSGNLKEAQVTSALAASREAGHLFSQYLIDTNTLSAEVLGEVLAQLADIILLEVFQYRSGSFSVAELLPDAVINGPIRLKNAVADSLRRLEEQEERVRQEQRKTLAKIKERLHKGEYQLPVLPDMIMHLLTVIENDNSTFNDLVRVVITDQLLVSRILRVANSPLYAAGERIDSIHMAIARMGMQSIVNIATAFRLTSLSIPGVPEKKLHAILDDAIKTAFLAAGLARNCRVDPEEAFLGGLLHDLGKTVMLSLAQLNSVDAALQDDFIAEHHAEIGALVAGKWNYPESIQNVILHHHNCRYSGSIDKVVAVVQLAGNIIEHGPEHDEPEIRAELNLQPADIREQHQQAVSFFTQMKRT